MRLIDANKCFDAIVKWAAYEECTPIAEGACKAAEIIASCPTVDAVEVVRCKDCKHGEKCYGAGGVSVSCEFSVALKDPNGFCDDGDPKEVSE